MFSHSFQNFPCRKKHKASELSLAAVVPAGGVGWSCSCRFGYRLKVWGDHCLHGTKVGGCEVSFEGCDMMGFGIKRGYDCPSFFTIPFETGNNRNTRHSSSSCL